MAFTLNREGYWKIDLEEKDCSFFSSKCTVYVAFCGELPDTLCAGSSVCVTNATGTVYSLGQYNPDPFLSSELYNLERVKRCITCNANVSILGSFISFMESQY